MVMWAAVLEGADSLGDFDAACFAGPQDVARFFGFHRTNDMAKLDAFYDKRVAADPEIREGHAGGPDQGHIPTLLSAARVSGGEPRGARRVEHLPAGQRQAPRRCEDRQSAIGLGGQSVSRPQIVAEVSGG